MNAFKDNAPLSKAAFQHLKLKPQNHWTVKDWFFKECTANFTLLIVFMPITG